MHAYREKRSRLILTALRRETISLLAFFANSSGPQPTEGRQQAHPVPKGPLRRVRVERKSPRVEPVKPSRRNILMISMMTRRPFANTAFDFAVIRLMLFRRVEVKPMFSEAP